MAGKQMLEKRVDLYRSWKILKWLNVVPENREDNERLLKIWLELFMALYGDLSERVKENQERDRLFLHFTNEVFPAAIDQYKWYESERLGYDIGLWKTLENTPMEHWYIETLSGFSEVY